MVVVKNEDGKENTGFQKQIGFNKKDILLKYSNMRHETYVGII